MHCHSGALGLLGPKVHTGRRVSRNVQLTEVCFVCGSDARPVAGRLGTVVGGYSATAELTLKAEAHRRFASTIQTGGFRPESPIARPEMGMAY
jgi:hypothetical protein